MKKPEMKFPAIFVGVGKPNLDEMNAAMQEYTMKAARGECSWICSDCGASCATGMPDTCIGGVQACTNIIQRDKAEAFKCK